MTDGSGLSPLQLTLITGTFFIANLAAIWLIRRNFFNSDKKTPPSPSTSVSILDVTEWNEFELIEKVEITHNTSVYKFKLPKSDSVLPLPIGQVKE